MNRIWDEECWFSGDGAAWLNFLFVFTRKRRRCFPLLSLRWWNLFFWYELLCWSDRNAWDMWFTSATVFNQDETFLALSSWQLVVLIALVRANFLLTQVTHSRWAHYLVSRHENSLTLQVQRILMHALIRVPRIRRLFHFLCHLKSPVNKHTFLRHKRR